MIRSVLLGAIAGMRSMLPLATLCCMERPRKLSLGLLALAVGELVGDKWSGAPDRISLPGLAARVTTGGLVAAAVAPRQQRQLAVVLGSVAAVTAGYASFALRVRAMRRFDQVTTGVAEDAIALAATLWILMDRRR